MPGFEKITALTGNTPPKITVVFGNDDFMLHLAIQRLKNTWVTKGSGELTWHFLAPEEIKVETLAVLQEEVSLFENKPLYFLSQGEKCKGLLASLKRCKPKSQSHILISYKSKKIPVALSRELKRLECDHLIEVTPPKPSNAASYLNFLLEDMPYTLSRDAQRYLQNHVEENWLAIGNELGALAYIFPETTKPLTVKDIAPCLTLIKHETAFKLENYLLEQKHSETHMFVRDLLDRGENALALLGIITRFYRNILHFHVTHQPVNRYVPPTVIRKYKTFSSSQTRSNLRLALRRCQEADSLLKSSRIKDGYFILADTIHP